MIYMHNTAISKRSLHFPGVVVEVKDSLLNLRSQNTRTQNIIGQTVISHNLEICYYYYFYIIYSEIFYRRKHFSFFYEA
jgi:hypothetical protein